jgi:NAD(P)-dependent dehydrogenase (short-subunit alcohol dehydrogenase family)
MRMTPVTVVTGANSGIGRATAVHLAQQGHRVIGTLRSLAKAEKLNAMAKQAGVAVELVVMDVADDDSVKRGFAEIRKRAATRSRWAPSRRPRVRDRLRSTPVGAEASASGAACSRDAPTSGCRREGSLALRGGVEYSLGHTRVGP